MSLLPGKSSTRSNPLVDKGELSWTTVATYGLQVPPGDIIIPAIADFPATVST